jgi:hypothetical protein
MMHRLVFATKVRQSSQVPESAVELLPFAPLLGLPEYLDLDEIRALRHSLLSSSSSAATRQSYSSMPVCRLPISASHHISGLRFGVLICCVPCQSSAPLFDTLLGFSNLNLTEFKKDTTHDQDSNAPMSTTISSIVDVDVATSTPVTNSLDQTLGSIATNETELLVQQQQQPEQQQQQPEQQQPNEVLEFLYGIPPNGEAQLQSQPQTGTVTQDTGQSIHDQPLGRCSATYQPDTNYLLHWPID